jgi:hypothetical protein
MHSVAPANLAAAIAPLTDFTCCSLCPAFVVNRRINKHLHASKYCRRIEVQFTIMSIPTNNGILDGTHAKLRYTGAILALGRIGGFPHISGERICHNAREIDIYLYHNIVCGTHSTDGTPCIEGPLQLHAEDTNAARNILPLLQSLRVALGDGNQGKII